MAGKAKKSHHLSSNLLLLPPSMKDFASCFSDHAVKVSDTSCSCSSSGGGGDGGSSSVIADGGSSMLSSITCLYRTRLSTRKELLLRVTWSKAHASPTLSVGVDEAASVHANSQLLRKKKGTRSFVSGSCTIGLHWDVSSANFEASPEPAAGFYVVVVVDSEIALSLGDLSGDYVMRLEEALPVAESSMVSRREQVIGHATHSTRARFGGEGETDHEITIACKGDAELWVCVDKKRVVHVRDLRWNFRGNQTVFIEGSPVDVMWDVHGWRFGGAAGCAVFMFRARSSLESRLWLEEEGAPGFSLLIQAFKNAN